MRIWRALSTGVVAHAFTYADDTQAICGRLLHYSLGTWLDGKNEKPECKACAKLIAEGK